MIVSYIAVFDKSRQVLRLSSRCARLAWRNASDGGPLGGVLSIGFHPRKYLGDII